MAKKDYDVATDMLWKKVSGIAGILGIENDARGLVIRALVGTNLSGVPKTCGGHKVYVRAVSLPVTCCDACGEALTDGGVRTSFIPNDKRHLGAAESESLDLCRACAGK